MIKTPIGAMMDLAKKDISTVVQNIMNNNNLPPDIMIYILESVTYDLARLRHMQDAEMYAKNERVEKE